MKLHLSPDQEARLSQLASKTGTDAESLVKDAVLRLLEREIPVFAGLPQLPVLRLGEMKSLHRRDMYTDAG